MPVSEVGDDVAPGRRRSPLERPLGLGIGAVFVLIGAALGAATLDDNSFFTHLATGRLILDEGSVPSVDPYTFHSAGEPWLVQSWFASVLYALSEDLVGLAGPRLVHLLLGALAAAITWRLSWRAGSLLPRVLIASVSLVAGASFWSERPLMIGLVAFGALLVLWERGPLWPLVPIMWVWVNSHGSYPLGIVLVATLLLGRWMDGGDLARGRRILGLVAVGTLVGGLLSPVAGRVLVFPLSLLGRSEVLQAVPEWRSPDFSQWGARAFLVVVILALLASARGAKWELVLPAAAFTGAALLGARNIPVAVLAVTPLLVASAPTVGDLRSETRTLLGGAMAVVAGLGSFVVVLSLSGGDHLALESYPITEIHALEVEGALPADPLRVAHPDIVGNYLELRHGATGTVFFDDRFDMYPDDVLDDMVALHQGRRVLEVLDAYDVDVVLWESETAVSEVLDASTAWVADPPLDPLDGAPERDDGTTGWTIFRRAASLGG